MKPVRSIALSAALFNGATFTMNHIGPELKAYNADLGDKAPITLNDYITPLKDLQIFNFETPQCQQFVQELGGIMQDWGEIGILDPDTKYEPLAELTSELHTQFIDAERAACKGNTIENMGLFLRLLAEDNAHAVLHSLIGLGGLTVYGFDERVDADYIAREAITEQRKLAGLASVSRPFAQNRIRHTASPDWRAADVVAYERALLTGEPMPRSSTESYFVIKNGEIVSPHSSLAEGELSEAQMCSGFLPHRANFTLNNGNISFFKEVGAMFDVPRELNRPKSRYSSTEAGINLGILVGRYTIYPDFPLVA